MIIDMEKVTARFLMKMAEDPDFNFIPIKDMARLVRIYEDVTMEISLETIGKEDQWKSQFTAFDPFNSDSLLGEAEEAQIQEMEAAKKEYRMNPDNFSTPSETELIDYVNECKAYWTNDCGAKQDLDFNVLRVEVRYWDDFTARPTIYLGKKKIRQLPDRVYIEGNSEKECKQETEKWINRNLSELIVKS